MSAQENVDLVRRGYEAFNTADMATLTELFDENASWHTPGHSSIAGDFVGRDAVFGQFGKFGAGTDGTFRADLQHIAGNEDGTVIGVHRNTGERNGKKLDVICCLVFEVRDGRAVSGTEHFGDLYAWDEFWA